MHRAAYFTVGSLLATMLGACGESGSNGNSSTAGAAGAAGEVDLHLRRISLPEKQVRTDLVNFVGARHSDDRWKREGGRTPKSSSALGGEASKL